MALNRLVVGLILVVSVVVGWREWTLSLEAKPDVLAAVTTKTLEDRVASLESRVSVLEKRAGIGVSVTKKATTSYVALTGGDISGSDWSAIPGTNFTFDSALYGNIIEVSWQGWLEGGPAAVRLYDATNNRAVDFSDFITTNDGKVSFYTKALSIWRGQNLYYIQGKTYGGTASLTLPQLRIIVR